MEFLLVFLKNSAHICKILTAVKLENTAYYHLAYLISYSFGVLKIFLDGIPTKILFEKQLNSSTCSLVILIHLPIHIMQGNLILFIYALMVRACSRFKNWLGHSNNFFGILIKKMLTISYQVMCPHMHFPIFWVYWQSLNCLTNECVPE